MYVCSIITTHNLIIKWVYILFGVNLWNLSFKTYEANCQSEQENDHVIVMIWLSFMGERVFPEVLNTYIDKLIPNLL